MSSFAVGAMAVPTASTLIGLCITCCEKILSQYLLSYMSQLPVSIFLCTLTTYVLFFSVLFLLIQYPTHVSQK